MSFTPQRAQESVQAATPTSEVTEITLGRKGKDGEAVQPLVSEMYADEKELRVAESVNEMVIKEADVTAVVDLEMQGRMHILAGAGDKVSFNLL
jgi:hypothetical protein